MLNVVLLKDPKLGEDDGEAGVRYGFEFKEAQPKNSSEHHWFKVGRILDFDSEDRFDQFIDEEWDNVPDDVPKGLERIFRRNMRKLYRAIWEDDFISFYTETDQDYDRVLDIFVRANEGGTKLSKSDLLLSMVTSKWKDMSARDEIYGFVDRINDDLTGKNNFNKDFIMKSCLVLTDLPVQYKVENFNIENLALIQSKWNNIKSAVERGVDLTNYFGIDRENLTSANALIPLIYYLYHRPNAAVRSSSDFETKNRILIRKWLILALLNKVFGGSSDNILREMRTVIKKINKRKDEFPIDELKEVAKKVNRPMELDLESIYSLEYKDKLTFMALSLLYDDIGWGSIKYHKDHIFPQSLFYRNKMKQLGFDEKKQNRYLELRDRIGNLELLLDRENEEKSSKDFFEWLKTRDSQFRRKHLIPEDDSLLKFEKFEEFVEAREKLIGERLKQVLGIDE